MSGPYQPVDAGQSFPELEQTVLERWRERDVFHESIRRREGAARVRVLRGAADRQRAARLAPRAGARVQGRVPALQDDARPPGAPQGRLGHARPAGGARGGAASSGIQSKEDIERYGVAEFNQRCRESVLKYVDEFEQLTERIGFWVDTDDAYVTLDERVHRVGLVVAQGDLEEGPALPGLQGRAVLRALRHGAVLARGGAGLRGRRGPVGVRALPARGTSRACRFLGWTTTPWTLLSQRRAGRRPGRDLRARPAWATRR